MSLPTVSPCQHRRLVDRHFSGRISPQSESILRSHLPDCEPCRGYYTRHMIHADLVHARLRPIDRLAIGLGITKPALRRESARPVGMWVGLAVAACAILLIVRGVPQTADREFTARGEATATDQPQIEVYRVAGKDPLGPLLGWMSAQDELAFAYRNPTGFARLMVFGVDEHEKIYWFHPAWTDGQENPTAVSIDAGMGPFELREAIRHDFQGRSLRVIALFTNEALSVRAAEAWWQRADALPPGTVRVDLQLEVRP